MAEIDTSLLSGQHSDIRREAAEHTNEIVKESIKGDFAIRADVKDSSYMVSNTVGRETDRLASNLTAHHTSITDRFFDVGRDTADLRAQVAQNIAETRNAADRTAKDAQIAVLQNTIEGNKNTQYLSDKINNDGEKTRILVNELRDRELNRLLVERNAEVLDARYYGRHLRGHLDQSMYAAQNNQLQAFASQLQETRQGMVNFGTMAGVGQTSSSNNV